MGFPGSYLGDAASGSELIVVAKLEMVCPAVELEFESDGSPSSARLSVLCNSVG